MRAMPSAASGIAKVDDDQLDADPRLENDELLALDDEADAGA